MVKLFDVGVNVETLGGFDFVSGAYEDRAVSYLGDTNQVSGR